MAKEIDPGDPDFAKRVSDFSDLVLNDAVKSSSGDRVLALFGTVMAASRLAAVSTLPLSKFLELFASQFEVTQKALARHRDQEGVVWTNSAATAQKGLD